MKQSLYILRLLLIILFSITLFDKILDIGEFKHQLFLSPLIPENYINIISIFIILIEAITLFFLVTNKLDNLGFLLSSFLLSLFGFYLYFLVAYFSFTKPCGCGFILSFLNYNQHILLNFLLALLSGIAYYLSQNGKQKNVLA